MLIDIAHNVTKLCFIRPTIRPHRSTS